MHLEQLQFLARAAALLGDLASETEASKDHVTPYLPLVPVVLDGYLLGFLEDPDGLDSYSWREPTDEERTWWDACPK